MKGVVSCLCLLWVVHGFQHGILAQKRVIHSRTVTRVMPEDERRYYEGMLKSPVTEAKGDMLTPTLKLAGGTSAVLVMLLALFFLANQPAAAMTSSSYEPRGIVATDVIVFLIGTVPFLWAANEFWRRIAVGESFGTGSDSIVIAPAESEADEDQVRRFGGRRVLGQDAILAARTLMTIAAGSILLAGIAAYEVSN